ncbi:NTP transferase domain-containing protein [Candidatus Daviesbacteria bacterium]|nr:NTP transferase domain-containing protein [Candidatus Daviesbacteria bacterium]
MKAVILAGGLGSRLAPFTQIIPKPLLPIGESSVLEIQILSLKKHGFDEVFIATNYLAKYVKAFLGKGKKYGIKISFSQEKKPLGTCGPITLLKSKLTEPFFLLNGDILTTLNFRKAYDFALKNEANLVVVTKEIPAPFDFGNVKSRGDYLIDVEEKPNFKLEILAGMYIMKPAIFDLIPKNTYYGIDMLIKKMVSKKMKVGRYLMKEYWLDIGKASDYTIAQEQYHKRFSKLKDGKK